MKRTVLILVGVALILAGAGVVAWFATMPYPARMWWESAFQSHYSEAWPISRADFATAKSLVRQELRWREIITQVSVTGRRKIRFQTTYRWNGPLSAAGRFFVLRKLDGAWAIAEQTMWVS